MTRTEIRNVLIRRGEALLTEPRKAVPFTGDSNADALLNNLENYPHAFVLACLMARRWKAEKCWLVPYRFMERLGSFKFEDLVLLPSDRILDLFLIQPPLHLMKETMAGIFYGAIQTISNAYQGDASRIWRGNPSSATVVKRFLQFEGAGPKIATMAANILVRDFKIPVSDKYSIDISPDSQVRRTFERLGLASRGASNEELTYTAREMNPPYPGVFDLALWEIGRQWCRPSRPQCAKCYLRQHCPSARAESQ